MISEFPLFLFTLVGGAVGGGYLVASLLPEKDGIRPWALPLVSLVLLAAVGIGLFLHLGKPLGAVNALSNPGAGIAVEGCTSILFGALVLVDLILSALGKKKRVASVLAGCAGIALLCAMAYTYPQYIGVRPWGSWQSAAFMLFGGLALGAPFAALFVQDAFGDARMLWTAVVALLLGAVSVVLEGAFFAGQGISAAPFYVGALLVVVALCASLVARKGSPSWLPVAVLVLVVAGMAIARYAFYAVV